MSSARSKDELAADGFQHTVLKGRVSTALNKASLYHKDPVAVLTLQIQRTCAEELGLSLLMALIYIAPTRTVFMQQGALVLCGHRQ